MTDDERFMWDLYPAYAEAAGWTPFAAERLAFSRAQGRMPSPHVGAFAVRQLRKRVDALETVKDAAIEALSLMRWEHWDKDGARWDKRGAVRQLESALEDGNV